MLQPAATRPVILTSFLLPQSLDTLVALHGLDAASGAVRAAVEGGAGRALRHQRDRDAVRNPTKAGRAVLWELVG